MQSRADLDAVLDCYPGLAWLWDKQLRGWAHFVRAFVDHATAFTTLQGLERTICDIAPDLSDPHRNGRSVMRVVFSDNSQWYYKPRSGRQEAAWARLVEELNAAGFTPSLRAAEVRARREHCWMSSVSARPCKGKIEREKFDQRVGALLYLAHLFRAVDLHSGNVVSCGEHPVLVDCETFFHPETRLPPGKALEGENSLLRTGMFLKSGQPAGWPLTATSRKRRQDMSTQSQGSACGRLEVERGFNAMHEFLRSRGRKRSLKSRWAQLQYLPTRHIYRPTTFYSLLLEDSLVPEFLEDRIRRYRFLHFRLNDNLVPAITVQSEITQLLAGDIPVFYRRSAPPRRCLSEVQLCQVLRELGGC